MQSESECHLCGKGGKLICCDACPKVYHFKCLDISASDIDMDADYYCPLHNTADRAAASASTLSSASKQKRKRCQVAESHEDDSDSAYELDPVGDEDELDFEPDPVPPPQVRSLNSGKKKKIKSSKKVRDVSSVTTVEEEETLEETTPVEEAEEDKSLRYTFEYAKSGRAKCKTCQVKLPKSSLRVSVTLWHTMFGRVSYYKCLECVQLCVEVPEYQRVTEGPECPVQGGETLTCEDQGRVKTWLEESFAAEDAKKTLEKEQEQSKKRKETAEAHATDFCGTLLPFQKESLAWMTRQEQLEEFRGGILADEMGLGKTIQSIALISKQGARSSSSSSLPQNNSDDDDNVQMGGTLIVCPVSCQMQWIAEIFRFTKEGLWKICLYHGPKRKELTTTLLSQYDIVITTFSIIETEYRKAAGFNKVACKYCNKKYRPDRLPVHQKFYCGPAAELSEKQQKTSRRQKLKLVKAFEQEQAAAAEKEEEKSATPISKKPKVNLHQLGPLHKIHWNRIVLDEAHFIKDRSCNTAKAVFALNSTFKWCLTGTPLMNRIGDLLSLIRFLQLDPFAYYFCQAAGGSCNCKSLNYNIESGKCTNCGHSGISHYSYFNRKFVNPIKGYGYVAEGRLAMQQLDEDLLRRVLLRRTKQERADDISLPPKLVRVSRVAFDEREEDIYQAIYTQSKAQFNTYVESGTVLHNYAHIFDLLIRLRQAVNHPYLVLYSASAAARTASIASGNLATSSEQPILRTTSLDSRRQSVAASHSNAVVVHELNQEDGENSSRKDEEEEELPCALCHECLESKITSKCKHSFCKSCIEAYIVSFPATQASNGDSVSCPVCQRALHIDFSQGQEDEAEAELLSNRTVAGVPRRQKKNFLNRLESVEQFQSSTKIEALMEELIHMKQKDPSAKALVFSQFVNMLDLIEHRLMLGGVRVVKLSGGMTIEAREKTLEAFRCDASISVFLISLKAGGLALNLVTASHVFLMDPWWSPAAENQAIDRVHRLGQFKPCRATRFIITGTIEERILQLQEKKRLIFESTIEGNKGALGRLTEADLAFLFSS